MRRAITAALLAALAPACGPETDDEPDVPGTLEYEHPYVRIYRLDGRVDIVLVKDDGESRECGVLTERARTELEETLSALDPNEDYGHDPEAQDCAPGALVHIEGFEHSPFACDFMCCRPELVRAAIIYWLIENHFDGFGPLEFDGEPYVAIEPDMPCP